MTTSFTRSVSGPPIGRSWVRRGVLSSLVLISASLAGCSDDDATAQDTEVPTDSVTVESVVQGLDLPVFAIGLDHPDAGELLYIVQQRGRILVLVEGETTPRIFLDIDARVPDIGGNDERGLLGLALHPQFVENGRFYVNYTSTDTGGGRGSNPTVIEAFRIAGDDPTTADPASAEELLRIPQPFSNHNGGWIAFGPDGYLHIGMGDGGSAGDPGNRAQDRTELLGKVLRIDVDGSSGELAYGIPPDNPYVGNGEGWREEIWSYGWRNPWRCSFDSATGDFWAADVGQNEHEEIDYEPAGAEGGRNYGWPLLEGNECYRPDENCDPAGETIRPIHTYGRDQGASVTGGHVYRGDAIPDLDSHYFFADFVSGNIWSLTRAGSDVTVYDRTSQLAPENGDIEAVSCFGIDAAGELLIVDRGFGREQGEIWRVVPAEE